MLIINVRTTSLTALLGSLCWNWTYLNYEFSFVCSCMLAMMMWSSSLSLILKLLVALSIISMFSESNTCVGFSCKCVWSAESFLGLRCSLILCAKILSVLPMHVCLHVSSVSLSLMFLFDDVFERKQLSYFIYYIHISHSALIKE